VMRLAGICRGPLEATIVYPSLLPLGDFFWGNANSDIRVPFPLCIRAEPWIFPPPSALGCPSPPPPPLTPESPYSCTCHFLSKIGHSRVLPLRLSDSSDFLLSILRCDVQLSLRIPISWHLEGNPFFQEASERAVPLFQVALIFPPSLKKARVLFLPLSTNI